MHSSLPSIGDSVGNYRLLRRIGAGGMGVVFEALNVDTDGKVALKFLSPELLGNEEALKRFRLEAKATGRIQHPNVVAVHNIGEHEGQLYLVMEFLRGRSLREQLAQGLFSVEKALSIMFPVMRGVSAAHAQGVLHRDLKPENIFLVDSPDGLEATPKVLDFGIAKLTSEAEGTNGPSARTAFMGTYQYMAFEQLHARKDLDARVDVYALATVLYHILTGSLPYKADNPVDLALAMLQSEPTPLSEHDRSLPEGLSQVLTSALARDREHRYPDIDTFGASLEPWAGGLKYRQGGVGLSAGSSVPAGLGKPQHAPNNGASWRPPGQSDSGRIPSVVSSPTPFVVRTDADDSIAPPRRNAVGLGVAAALALSVIGWGVVHFSRGGTAAAPAPAAPAPVAAQAPSAIEVQQASVSAEVPRNAALDAGLNAENDDWGKAPPSPHIEPAAAPQEPVVQPGAGTIERSNQNTKPNRSAREPSGNTEVQSRRKVQDATRKSTTESAGPRTRSGLSVSSDEF